jgi:hypothetical protein
VQDREQTLRAFAFQFAFQRFGCPLYLHVPCKPALSSNVEIGKLDWVSKHAFPLNRCSCRRLQVCNCLRLLWRRGYYADIPYVSESVYMQVDASEYM